MGPRGPVTGFPLPLPLYSVNMCQSFSLLLYNEPKNAQLIDNLLYCSLLWCSYMFGHYCVIFRELVPAKLHGPVCPESECVSSHTQTQYKLGRNNDSINIQNVYTATTQDFLIIVMTK
jgi:hypothetical protein